MTSLGVVLVSIASVLKFVVRVLSWTFGIRMELRGDEMTAAGAAVVGEVVVLFSMLLVLLLLLISPFVFPIRFSVE